MPLRSFGLNSQLFTESACEPLEQPWIRNGSLPPELRWPRNQARLACGRAA